MKKLSFLLILVLLMSILTGCQNSGEIEPPKEVIKYHADYPYYSDIDSVLEAADLVVVGKIASVSAPVEHNISNGKPFHVIATISGLEIEKVLKGDIAKDTLQIYQLGGIKDDILYLDEGVEHLEKGTRGIFFLVEPRVDKEKPYFFINPGQGFIKLTNGKIEYNKNLWEGNKVFEGISSEKLVIQQIVDSLKKAN